MFLLEISGVLSNTKYHYT